MLPRFWRTLVALAVVVTLCSVSPAAASSTADLQGQVDAVIAEFGGTQTAPNEVSWDGGRVVLTIQGGGIEPFAVGSCATGKFCAYSVVGLAGNKLTFSECSAANSTAPLGVVRSVANARSSGNVHAYNGSTVVLTVAAGKSANTTATITRLGC